MGWTLRFFRRILKVLSFWRRSDACKANGGFYLGSIGGPAAKLALDCIKKVEVLDFEELGMEAVFKIDVVDFPAFIVVDDKGNDFFAETSTPLSIGPKP